MAIEGSSQLTPLRTRQQLSLDFLAFLESRGDLTSGARRRAEGALAAGGERVEIILTELGLMDERVLLIALCAFLECSLMEQPEPNRELIEDCAADLSYLRRHALLPLAAEDGMLEIATCFPLDDQAARCLAYLRSAKLRLSVCSQQALVAGLDRLQMEARAETADRSQPEQFSELLDLDAERLRDLASEAPVIRLLNRLVSAAVERQASDIHMEPQKDRLQVRYRIDGVLQPVEGIDKAQQAGLTSRVKVLARLNIAEQRLPQDGKIRFVVKGRELDFRVSTMPSIDGEAIVLRILNQRHVELKLEALGFGLAEVSLLRGFIGEPNGIILVTGPTGSGKTTTLYALLKELNSEQRKIFTVEDPVEYQLPGITQIHVRPAIGLDFATVLRSVLRQDPDVIMIGEIRDGETARIAVQAALTGHLVLSTLHTNSALSSVARLRDLGIEDYLIASTLRGILSQRLVRTLCVACGGTPSATACSECGGQGFHGRTVVSEVLALSDRLRTAISARAAETELGEIAQGDGFRNLAGHAGTLVSDGRTTQTEVTRSLGVSAA